MSVFSSSLPVHPKFAALGPFACHGCSKSDPVSEIWSYETLSLCHDFRQAVDVLGVSRQQQGHQRRVYGVVLFGH
jgi:hypothetical protein